MVSLDRIYTRGGDAGETSLGDGTRVLKTDPLVASYGAVDEANAAIGLVRIHTIGEDDNILARIQNDMFDVGSDLCVPFSPAQATARPALRVVAAQVDWLERQIDRMNAELSPLKSFILPGGTAASAYLHLARTITRRAERETVAAMRTEGITVNPAVIHYLNRLSDLLFVMGRYLNDRGKADVLWVPGANRAG